MGLNFNLSELSESLMRDGAVSLVNGRIQLMLTGADEEDFYGLNNISIYRISHGLANPVDFHTDV